MASVTFDRVTLQYPGARAPSVDDLSLDIADGEFLVLVGPSGCGKSTTLRMLAGLEQVSRGTISIGGDDVTEQDPKDRDIAMVFQNYALYPHMTVADNMGFALRLAGASKSDIRSRVERAADMLDLTPYLGRRPKELSGGQRQRVAMGRAIVREPRVFCMDEPLSNLDAKLRVQTRTQIAQLQRRLGTTTVYVTHDQVEAMTMGDRVAVLSAGVLQQVAPPRELYARPANVFVAGFIGSPAMNLVSVRADADGAISLGSTRVLVGGDAGGADLVVGVRPEHLVADPGGEIELEVDVVEELGADAYLYGRGRLAGDEPGPLVARVDWASPPAPGERVRLAVDAEHVHVFDAASGARRENSRRA